MRSLGVNAVVVRELRSKYAVIFPSRRMGITLKSGLASDSTVACPSSSAHTNLELGIIMSLTVNVAASRVRVSSCVGICYSCPVKSQFLSCRRSKGLRDWMEIDDLN